MRYVNNWALIIIMLGAEMVTQNFVCCFDCDEKEISGLLNAMMQLFQYMINMFVPLKI